MGVFQVAGYELQDQPLFRDAGGALFQGVRIDTGELVLVKELAPGLRKLPGQPGFAQLREVQHPALVPLLEEVTAGSRHYVVSAYPDGELLSARLPELRRGGISGRGQLARAVLAVLPALDALHQAGLVHGQVHPGAILIKPGPQGEAALLCFSPFVPRQARAYLQEEQALPYVAQEQLRGGGSPASDLYALGMLLFAAFAERLPVEGATPYALAEAVVWGDLLPFSPNVEDLTDALRPALLPALESLASVANRAVQRSPQERCAGVAEFIQALEPAAHSLSPIVLGRALYQRRQFPQAAAVLQEAVETADAAEANNLLGRIYGFELKEYEPAVIAFKRAIKLAPGLESPRLGLADLYTLNGRYALAKREYMQLFELSPNNPQLMMQYAGLLEKTGSGEGAANLAQKVVEINPYYWPAYIFLIQMQMAEGSLREAEAVCSRAVELIVKVQKTGKIDPAPLAQIYYLRGSLHLQQGRAERAVTWLNKALEQSYDHIESHLLLTEIYMQMGDVESAQRHFMAALNLNPQRAGVLESIGRIFGDHLSKE